MRVAGRAWAQLERSAWVVAAALLICILSPAALRAHTPLDLPIRALPDASFAAASDLPTRLMDTLASTWASFESWVRRNHARAPALMLGLAAIVVLPVLAIFVFLIRWMVVRPRTGTPRPAFAIGTTPYSDGLTWPVDAWIEIDGASGSKRPFVQDMLRIGREDDNDIVIANPTVHRYHAIIRRTEDAEFVVTDVSPPEGNGMAVNGERQSEVRLRNGDTIALGEARLRFTARPVDEAAVVLARTLELD